MKIQKLKSESPSKSKDLRGLAGNNSARKGESVFSVSGVTPSFVNVIRRACSFEVPTLALEDIYFVKNTSALYDEILSHRLGLIPLTTDLKSYITQESCNCKGEGCAKCTVKLTLKVAGPVTVKAKDLKSTDPVIKPVYPEMLIVELLEGQEIELEAIAILGKGKEHVKWSAGHSFYRKEEGKDDQFVFTIEPWGQLSTSNMLKAAVKVLTQKVKDLRIK